MFFQFKHVTRYSYSQPVFCDPLTIRLRPREDAAQRLLRYRTEIWPPPAGVSEHVDLAGNVVTLAWFTEMTLSLSITTACLVETLNVNPYHFVVEQCALRLPLCRECNDRGLAAHYLHEEEPSPVVARFANAIAEEVDHQTVPFVGRLASALFERTERMIRDSGEAWPAERTLQDARGSCRDFAVLFNACCRALGLPARFVSGYAPPLTHHGELHLHAWSEVYLPGAGWRGFDASRGLAVSDQHVPVAAARRPRDAAPTQGTFRGAGVQSQLSTQIAMSTHAVDPREL